MNINQFKSELADGGARPNLYKVTVPFPVFAGGSAEVRRVSFLCRGAQLPGQTIGNIDVPFMGRQVKIPGDKTFEEWTITVFADGEFVTRNAFEKWNNGIARHSENTGLPISEIYVDATIEQLNRQGETIKTYTMVGAYPSVVAPIEVAFDSNDAIEEFTVTLNYQYWLSDTVS